jgi:hypothetical protein
MIAHIPDTPQCPQCVKCIEFTLKLAADKNERKPKKETEKKPKSNRDLHPTLSTND